MSRKRKLFLGAKPIGGPSLKSRRIARRVTSKYHNIRQQVATIEQRPDLTEAEKKKELKKLKDELTEMGGINRYQEASVISTQHFQTSKWIVQALKRLNRISHQPTSTTHENGNEEDEEEEDSVTSSSDGAVPSSSGAASSARKLKTLEVGAINDQLCKSPFLNVKAIDINARLPCIEELDFFNLLPTQQYEVVVCSMVINCVFDPIKRAEMLGRLNMQLTENGILFLILPKRCIQNSNMEGSEQFVNLLRVFGFQLLEEPHFTPRLAFYVLSRNHDLYNRAVRKLKSNANLGTDDSNDAVNSSWSQVMKWIISFSSDEITKTYFDKSELNIEEFCLRIPGCWIGAGKKVK